MTNPMLAELDAVVPVAWICDAPDDGVRTAVVAKALADMCERNGWKITPLYDHATLADMAKRLEAAERDAAYFRWHYTKEARTESNALVEIQLRILGDDYPTIDEVRAAYAEAIDATQEGEG